MVVPVLISIIHLPYEDNLSAADMASLPFDRRALAEAIIRTAEAPHEVDEALLEERLLPSLVEILVGGFRRQVRCDTLTPY